MSVRGTAKAVRFGGRSPVRSVLLATLVERPGHGYDIASRAGHRVGYLWSIDHKHIYSHLKWFASRGLAYSRQERFETWPYVRDIYYATDAGREARNEWLAAPLSRRDPRVDLEVRLLFSAPDDIPVLLREIGECGEYLAEEIERNEAGDAEPVSYSTAMTNLQRAAIDKRLKAEVEWLQEARAELEGLRDRPPPR
jgi:DNA-binding PadR family transcriptional regulator